MLLSAFLLLAHDKFLRNEKSIEFDRQRSPSERHSWKFMAANNGRTRAKGIWGIKNCNNFVKIRSNTQFVSFLITRFFFGNRFAYNFHPICFSSPTAAPHDNNVGEPRIMDITYLMSCLAFIASVGLEKNSIFNWKRHWNGFDCKSRALYLQIPSRDFERFEDAWKMSSAFPTQRVSKYYWSWERKFDRNLQAEGKKLSMWLCFVPRFWFDEQFVMQTFQVRRRNSWIVNWVKEIKCWRV